jgi:hypothetical protein
MKLRELYQTISYDVLTASCLIIQIIEKEAFKQGVKKMSRDFNKEQNFEEAVKESYKVFSTKGLPCEVTQLLDSQRGKPLSADSTEFEYVLNAKYVFLHTMINVFTTELSSNDQSSI